MHTVTIHNRGHNKQEFEIHGYNDNKNVTVGGGQKFSFQAADGTSGAVIALHDGHEGEQAEITKSGFGGKPDFRVMAASSSFACAPFPARLEAYAYGLPLIMWIGNDFFDVSVIVGAGGNMTIQQVGDPSTRKGDPTFMQDLAKTWHKADEKKRQSLKGWVFTNSHGDPVRIGAPKERKELEEFVRLFADGKVYIGVGAWRDDPGRESDNKLVSFCQLEVQNHQTMDGI